MGGLIQINGEYLVVASVPIRVAVGRQSLPSGKRFPWSFSWSALGAALFVVRFFRSVELNLLGQSIFYGGEHPHPDIGRNDLPLVLMARLH